MKTNSRINKKILPENTFAGEMEDGARMFKKHPGSGLLELSFADLQGLKEGILDKLQVDEDPNYMTLLRLNQSINEIQI